VVKCTCVCDSHDATFLFVIGTTYVNGKYYPNSGQISPSILTIP
jgi:hypothetical protein